MLSAERHACELAANTVKWLLAPRQLEHAPAGYAAHLKLARTGLQSAAAHFEAASSLLGTAEEP